MIQITGNDLRPGQISHSPGELADPSPPILVQGKIRIYGTGSYYLEFNSWAHFLKGEGAERIPMELYHPDGTKLEGHQSAWDLLLHRWSNHTEVIHAGVMTPTGDRKQARWPEDNWNRRIYPFTKNADGKWVRHPQPLFAGPVPPKLSWLNHSYGHHFETDCDGVTYIFYEKVTEERKDGAGNSLPYRTEIFARKMVGPYLTDPHELHIFGIGSPPYLSTVRQHPLTGVHNGYLVEGPRPHKVTLHGEAIYLLGFSSGDFPTDRYALNIAWSRKLTGPYQPWLENNDLRDFGKAIKQKHNLSWGPARPAFFQDPQENLWVLFHSVDKKVLADRDYASWPEEALENFHRNLYLAPVSLEFNAEGQLEIAIEAT